MEGKAINSTKMRLEQGRRRGDELQMLEGLVVIPKKINFTLKGLQWGSTTVKDELSKQPKKKPFKKSRRELPFLTRATLK